MSEMKNTRGRINSRLYVVEKKISELEDITIEAIQGIAQRGKWIIKIWMELHYTVGQLHK